MSILADLQWGVLTPASAGSKTTQTGKGWTLEWRIVFCLLRLDQEELCSTGEVLESVVGRPKNFFARRLDSTRNLGGVFHQNGAYQMVG